MRQSNSLKTAKVSEAEIDQAKATEAKIGQALEEFLSVTQVKSCLSPLQLLLR